MLRAIEASIKASDAERAEADALDAGVARSAPPRPTREPARPQSRRPPSEAPCRHARAASRSAPAGRRLQERAARRRRRSPTTSTPDPCKSPEQVAKLPGHRRRHDAREAARRRASATASQVTSPTIGIYLRPAHRARPIAKQFRVIAIFEAGFDQYDSKLVYTDLYEAQAFYEHGDSVTGVEMKVDDIDQARGIAKEIEQAS